MNNSDLKNDPQYLSGLSRALFPTTFFEIAVYRRIFHVDSLIYHRTQTDPFCLTGYSEKINGNSLKAKFLERRLRLSQKKALESL